MENDIDIIQQVLDGDTETFRILVERYERPVMRFVQLSLFNPEEAPDLAQEVFLTAFRKLRSFDPALSRFSTWLLTIARNRTINANKKKRPQTISVLPERADTNRHTYTIEHDEWAVLFEEALNRLPAKQRRAFVLSQIEELPYEVVAQIEGARLGTIKSRVNRARAKLQASLEKPHE